MLHAAHAALADFAIDHDEPARPAPGRVTLTSRLPPAASGPAPFVGPIQRKESGGASIDPFAIHTIADQGVAGASSHLPYLDDLRASFGRHAPALDGARAQIGGAAASASEALGARAYATGDRIAFASSPDRALVAHEAAHVVQQRAGVSLSAAVGSPGDAYEQHADEVAAAFSRGESAEPILDRMPTGGGDHAAVQRKEAEPSAREWDDAASVLRAIEDIVDNHQARLIAATAAPYRAALESLHRAVVLDDMRMPGRERVDTFDRALAALEPVLAMYAARPDTAARTTALRQRIGTQRQLLLRGEARARVDNSLHIDGRLVEIPDDHHPREQAAVLRPQLTKLVKTIGVVNEAVIRIGHDKIHHALEHLNEGKPVGGVAQKLGRLVEVMHVLNIADGWLTLTDGEFQHELHNIHGVFQGVATYSELLKAVVEIAGGTVGLTATFAAAIAKSLGQEAMAATASGLARASGLLLGDVIAGVEIIHGLAVLLDPHASGEQKDHAIFSTLSSLIWLGGRMLGGGALTVGAIAALAPLAGYLYAKAYAAIYWQTNITLVASGLFHVFEYLQRRGGTLATGADELGRAGELLAQERDPDRARAMSAVEAAMAQSLGRTLDDFLGDCLPQPPTNESRMYPGKYVILREKFAPLQRYRGVRTGPEVAAAAGAILEAIVWCLNNAGDIVAASAHQMHLDELERDQAKERHAREQEHGRHADHRR